MEWEGRTLIRNVISQWSQQTDLNGTFAISPVLGFNLFHLQDGEEDSTVRLFCEEILSSGAEVLYPVVAGGILPQSAEQGGVSNGSLSF